MKVMIGAHISLLLYLVDSVRGTDKILKRILYCTWMYIQEIKQVRLLSKTEVYYNKTTMYVKVIMFTLQVNECVVDMTILEFEE